jgi:hypothetical protein
MFQTVECDLSLFLRNFFFFENGKDYIKNQEEYKHKECYKNPLKGRQKKQKNRETEIQQQTRN